MLSTTLMWRVPYEKGDAELLAPHLRPSDRAYFRAFGEKRPVKVLRDNFKEYDVAYTFFVGHQVAACLAIKDDNLWLQTNALTDGCPRSVIKSGIEVAAVLPKKPLFCVVPVDDERVLRLAKVMGFTQTPEIDKDYLGSGIPHVTLWRHP